MASAAPTTDDHQVAKLANQLQITRLKREEEEELWISGEELCTEGSSDEEDGKVTSRSNKSNKSNKQHDPPRFAKVHWRATEGNVNEDVKCQKIEDFAKDSEISWKANKELSIVVRVSLKISYSLMTSSTKDRENMGDSIETLGELQEDLVPIDNEQSCGDSANTEKEFMQQFSKVENLDAAIRELEINIKKATEETLKLQLENRRKLKESLSLKAPETGKLAENTQKFFGLCKEYENSESSECD